jgi:acyl-CoA thioester hydrolase
MHGFKVVTPLLPRFRDTDAMGHLNNAVYLTYFEVARTAYWTALTGTRNYHEVPFILAHTTIDFRSPAFVYERLMVGIRVARLGNSSFDCAYRIAEEESDRLVCEGRSVQVIFDYARGKSYPMPEELKARVRAFEGDPGLG